MGNPVTDYLDYNMPEEKDATYIVKLTVCGKPPTAKQLQKYLVASMDAAADIDVDFHVFNIEVKKE